jgi:hypothetical protein
VNDAVLVNELNKLNDKMDSVVVAVARLEERDKVQNHRIAKLEMVGVGSVAGKFKFYSRLGAVILVLCTVVGTVAAGKKPNLKELVEWIFQ